jgi:PAS domain S-box-containing protein
MNVYAWLSLSAGLISVSLGVIVYSLNRKKLLNKLFLLTALAGFYWAFTEFMMWQASNVVVANFWSKMGFLWPFFVVLVVHFSLVYTESNWLKNKFIYIILYLPAVIFAFTDLTTELINGPPIMETWGFEDTPTSSLAYGVSTFWSALLPVLALVLCAIFSYRASEGTKKQQSKLITVGFAVPILAYLITNLVFPSFDIDIPNLGHIAVAFFACFVAYAILKYELFTFDAAMAAENIISTMPDSLILADMNGKMLKMNKRLVNFLGYKEDELIGKSIISLCVEDSHCMSVLKELPEKRIVRNYELKFITKSGEEKTVLFSGSVVRSKTGRDIGITCVIHDITEHRKMEERLVKAERLASIGELAGQIGHDLRNPLTGIKSGAYYLRKKGDRLTEVDKKKILETIDNAVEDSNRIISGLVDYASDLKLEVSTCTPKSLFSSTLPKIKIPNRIEVIDHLLDEPEISVDVSKFESVLTKIIMNAIEAMPQNGTLELRSTQKGSNIEIAFIDSGIGIPENVLPKVFSPLTTTKAKGMGLGLAICKRIVDAHGGKIRVESTVGKGTTLTITVPINPKIKFAVQNDWVKIETLSSVRKPSG